MELLDKYLQNVRTYLPREQRDDIIKELSDNILSQMEDKESELGRPLTAVEQEAIIKQHGEPMTVVGSYQLDTRSVAFGRLLIGPVLYPFYIRVLSITMGLSLAAHLLISMALYAAGQLITIEGLISSLIVHLAIQFSIITVIFTAAQANAIRFPDVWDPVAQVFENSGTIGAKGESRFEAFAELVVLVVVFLWLLNVETSQTLILGAGGAVLTFAPIWQTLYIPALLLTFAGIANSAIIILCPEWTRFRLFTSVLIDVAALILGGVLLMAGEWIVLANPAAAPHDALQMVDSINNIAFWCLLISLFVCGGMALFDTYKLLRLQQNFTVQRV